jgi:hypothetical protein
MRWQEWSEMLFDAYWTHSGAIKKVIKLLIYFN